MEILNLSKRFRVLVGGSEVTFASFNEGETYYKTIESFDRSVILIFLQNFLKTEKLGKEFDLILSVDSVKNGKSEGEKVITFTFDPESESLINIFTNNYFEGKNTLINFIKEVGFSKIEGSEIFFSYFFKNQNLFSTNKEFYTVLYSGIHSKFSDLMATENNNITSILEGSVNFEHHLSLELYRDISACRNFLKIKIFKNDEDIIERYINVISRGYSNNEEDYIFFNEIVPNLTAEKFKNEIKFKKTANTLLLFKFIYLFNKEEIHLKEINTDFLINLLSQFSFYNNFLRDPTNVLKKMLLETAKRKDLSQLQLKNILKILLINQNYIFAELSLAGREVTIKLAEKYEEIIVPFYKELKKHKKITMSLPFFTVLCAAMNVREIRNESYYREKRKLVYFDDPKNICVYGMNEILSCVVNNTKDQVFHNPSHNIREYFKMAFKAVTRLSGVGKDRLIKAMANEMRSYLCYDKDPNLARLNLAKQVMIDFLETLSESPLKKATIEKLILENQGHRFFGIPVEYYPSCITENVSPAVRDAILMLTLRE